MKKLLCLAMVLILSCVNVYAYEVESSVTINGQYLKSDTKNILIEDTVFVESRALVEAFGGKIGWLENTQSVIIQLEGKVIEFFIDKLEAKVNGEVVQMVSAPFIRDGRTMIPLRFVSEHFDCEVSWNESTYTANINKEGLIVEAAYITQPTYTDDDLYLLAKIVTVESGDGSLEMKLAIANTVLNRVKDSRFPNSIEEVIYQVDVSVQFPPAHRESFKTLEPSDLAIVAAKKTLEGVNNIGESLYFNNRPFTSKSDDLIEIIEGEYFYR